MTEEAPRPAFDTTRPHSARVWTYWLGGKDCFPADRDFGDKVLRVYPEIADDAAASRAFGRRVVAYLAGEAGVRQFLDVGCGLPHPGNTHEVAQQVNPACRVVYADNDPLVLVHARALMAGEGATAVVEADLRGPAKILAGAAETLDLTRPVALLLMGVLGYVADLEEAYEAVRVLVSALPAGSYLAAADGTAASGGPGHFLEPLRALNEGPGGTGYRNRAPEQVARFFDGLELVEPGVVSAPLWRPDPGGDAPVSLYVHGGVGRKEH